MNYTYFIVALLLLQSCHEGKRTTVRHKSLSNLYDVSIIYSLDSLSGEQPSYFGNTYYSKDSIYLFVEAYFETDSLMIYVNDRIFYHDIVTTEAVTGAAKRFNLGAIRDVNAIQLSISGGPMMLLNSFPTNTIALNYSKRKEARISFERRPRIYE